MNRVPKRIQRRRTKGWRMPEGAVNVARPGFWGNPFKGPRAMYFYRLLWRRRWKDLLWDREQEWNIPYLQDLLRWWECRLHELRGKILVCWCPLDRECHGDILLKKANA